MIKRQSTLILTFFILTSMVNAQVKKTDVEGRLREAGIELISPSAPVANYVKAVRVGNTIYLSGHGPDKPGGGLVTGKLGSDLAIEQGQEAARLVGISLLSTLKGEIGDLNKVKRVVKVTGFVNAVPSFEKHPQVMNGFSDLMVQVFGERGKHARSSVGVGSLPSNIPVEIEMIVEVRK
jgi:enamine deaminase RidA (YjgF/YER057c/UK114 family)